MKIVLQKQISFNELLVVRCPILDDAEAMMRYINALSQEQTFITFQGEKMELRDEINFVESMIKKIGQKQSVMLLAFINEQLVGIAQINCKEKISKHDGVFGISIAKKYRNKGIGKMLMENILKEAKQNLPSLRIVTLEVFGSNDLAQCLYKSFGFREFGRLPEGIHYREEYVDAVYMYKNMV